MATDLERIAPQPPVAGAITESDVDELIHHAGLIRRAQSQAMVKDEHYGVIPGTGSKPTLLKAGAEKLLTLFKLGPDYESVREWDNEHVHLDVTVKCTLRHIPTGNWVGTGEGSCSTRESRYAYRKGGLVCPECSVEGFLLKSRDRDEWFCWRNPAKGKLGCGEKFAANDSRITSQNPGRVANPDIADTYNTVLKMAQKRALIAAVLNATAASEVFTQDVEDFSNPSPSEGQGGDAPTPRPASPPTDPAKQPRSEAKWDTTKALFKRVQGEKGGEAAAVAWRFGMQRAREQGLSVDAEAFTLTDEGCDVVQASLRALLEPELPASQPEHNADDDIEVFPGEVVS